MTTVVEPQFLGAGWQGHLVERHRPGHHSAASRSTRRPQTSVSANDDGMRKLAMAAATITDLFDSAMSAHRPQGSCSTRAVSLVGEAIGDLANLQSSTGIVEKRVNDASDRIKMQVDLFERNIMRLEGVDPYEASTRVADLLSAHRNLLRAHRAHPATQPC